MAKIQLFRNKIDYIKAHIISMSSHCIKRIQREVREMPHYRSKVWTANPKGGYDLLNWDATIQNLDDPRHMGKSYRLSIEIPGNYPFIAPNVRFIDSVTSNICRQRLGHDIYAKLNRIIFLHYCN